MKNRDFKPLFMWIGLVAGIIAVALTRAGRTASVWSGSIVDGDTLFIGLYFSGVARPCRFP